MSSYRINFDKDFIMTTRYFTPLAVGIGLLLCSSHLHAKSFSDTYKDYQLAIEQNDLSQARIFAKQAYQLGLAEFDENDLSVANLAINYASLLVEHKDEVSKDHRKQSIETATQLYQQALAIYRVNFDDNAVELIELLIELAKVETDARIAKNLVEEAVDIANDSGKSLLIAETNIAAFNRIASTEYYTKSKQKWAFEALEIYETQYPENALDRIEAERIVAAIRYNRKDYKLATQHYTNIIEQMQALEFTHPFELQAHAVLVNIFEKTDKSDLATQHCLAIGQMKPWDADQEQQPLYRVPPEYPLAYAKRGKQGWVKMRFTVDEFGFVKDATIVGSEGGSKFEKASLKALKQWRYAPKFKNGKAISAESTVQLDFHLDRG